MDIRRYFDSKDDFSKYTSDLRYWCNALGELHKWGQYDLNDESELPAELRELYNTLWTDCPNSLLCYLTELDGKYGISLIAEYYEHEEDGMTSQNNYNHAYGVAERLQGEFDYPILLAKEVGFPSYYKDFDTGLNVAENATELVLFMPYGVTKEQFDHAVEFFGEYAYV